MFVTLLGVCFGLVEQNFCTCRELAGQTAVTGFVHEEVFVAIGRCLAVERELLLGQSRVVAEEIPVTALDGLVHFFLAVLHAALDAVHLARCIGNDEGRAGICFSFGNCLEGLNLVGAHCDLSHIDVTVGHCHLCKALALDFLTGSCKLCNLADVGSLGSLSAGVGVNFGVEYEYVDIFTGREDVVNAAVADIECPTVTAEDPCGLLVEEVFLGKDLSAELACIAGADRIAGSYRLRTPQEQR